MAEDGFNFVHVLLVILITLFVVHVFQALPFEIALLGCSRTPGRAFHNLAML